MKAAKTLMCLVLLGCCTVSHADLSNGPYVGLGANWNWSLYQFFANNNAIGFSNTRNYLEYNTYLHPLVGYGMTFCNYYYWGVEAGGYLPDATIEMNSPDVSLTTPFFQNQLKYRNYITADITPGYNFWRDILFLFRFGYSYARFDLNQKDAIGMSGFCHSQNLAGFRTGVSLKYFLTCHLSFGIDYVYTRYQKFSAIGPIPGFNTIDFSFTPITQNIGISLNYNF